MRIAASVWTHRKRVAFLPDSVAEIVYVGLTVLVVLVMWSSNAFAADYTVTKTADTNDGVCDSDCSLREAVIATNAHPGSDRIILASNLTYLLTLGPADASGALTPGSGDLDVTEALTIDGNGSTIDAGGLDRVLDIQGNFTVTINNLTIHGGAARGFLSLGGGIYVLGANLMMNGCTVTGNSAAADSVDDGGGIAVVGSYNPATAISTLAGLTLNSSTVSGNTGLNGGGIVCVLCALTISQSVISGNTSSGEGGGIDVVGNSSVVSMTSSALTTNFASGGSAKGGGLSVPFGASVVTLTRNRIVSNTGATGSAISNGVASVDAVNNWWGCNYGPSATGAGCLAMTNGVAGTVATNPYLILKITAPASLVTGAASPITADLTYNSSNTDTSSGGAVPNGTLAAFSGTLGTFALPSSPTTNGKASDVFTAGGVAGGAILNTTVDGQTVSAAVMIVISLNSGKRRSQITSQ